MFPVVWWENYVDKYSRLGGLTSSLVNLKRRIANGRTKLYLAISMWKIVVAFLMFMVYMMLDYDISDVFSFSYEKCRDAKSMKNVVDGGLINHALDWIWVWLTMVGCGHIGYFCARTAAKIRMQRLSMALPLFLSTPTVSSQ